MSDVRRLGPTELKRFHDEATQQFDEFKSRKLTLNLGRGKPSPEQLDLCNRLLTGGPPDRTSDSARDGSKDTRS